MLGALHKWTFGKFWKNLIILIRMRPLFWQYYQGKISENVLSYIENFAALHKWEIVENNGKERITRLLTRVIFKIK